MTPVRFSRLRLMGKSPAHYAGAEADETASMERGGAVHSIVLGGKRVMFYPGAVRRGKEFDAFAAANDDAIILTRTEYDKVMPMADAVRDNPLAQSILAGASTEVEIDWEFLGRSCQSHIDIIGSKGAHVAELKTCADGNPARLMWPMRRMGWNAQLAFYRAAMRHSGLGDPHSSYVIAVESTAPYVVTTLRLTDRALDQGERVYRLWFERLLVCEASGQWPGYCESVVDLDVPDDEPEFTYGEAA